ncbi:hypothetical protein EYC84_005711 [Monilinia fructicola]|nr:hypothetical protein EYC84_005711 [Monilinia fructicola]
MYVEKMNCAGESEELVRVIVNDRVLPLETCGGDELGRCGLSKFVESLSFASAGEVLCKQIQACSRYRWKNVHMIRELLRVKSVINLTASNAGFDPLCYVKCLALLLEKESSNEIQTAQ